MVRAFAAHALPFAMLIVAGAAVFALGESTVSRGIGLALAALGSVLCAVLLFYEVGRSEDRERAARLPSPPDDGSPETAAAQRFSRGPEAEGHAGTGAGRHPRGLASRPARGGRRGRP
jgi:hypothetical protein